MLPLRCIRQMFPEKSDAEGFPKNAILKPSEVENESYTDERLRHFGMIIIQVNHNGTQQQHPIRFYIVQTKNKVTTGQPTCHHLGLPEIKCNNKATHQIHAVVPTSKAHSKTTGGVTNKHWGSVMNELGEVISKPSLLCPQSSKTIPIRQL